MCEKRGAVLCRSFKFFLCLVRGVLNKGVSWMHLRGVGVFRLSADLGFGTFVLFEVLRCRLQFSAADEVKGHEMPSHACVALSA